MKISKIAHKININSKGNLKYRKFIKNFFLNPSNYFNQTCEGESFCLGKFYSQINERAPYYLNRKSSKLKHEFLIPLMNQSKKRSKVEKKKNYNSMSSIPKKEFIHHQELLMIFDKHENRIKENKKEEIEKHYLSKSFLKKNKLDYTLLKKQKNRLESFQKFKKENEKIENRLVKKIKRPKSQLLIYSYNQEKFRIRKEEREESNNYHNDEDDKMNYHFDKYLRTENDYNEDVENIKRNKLYIRKPDIPIPKKTLNYLKYKKNNTEINNLKPEFKLKRNFSGLCINGENLLKWEKDLIGKMKGRKFIYRNYKRGSNSSQSISMNSRRTLTIDSSYRGNLYTKKFSKIIENDNLFN